MTIKESSIPEWKLAEYVLCKRNDYPSSFLCRNHKHLLSKVNRVITNTYFSNEQRHSGTQSEKTILKILNKDKQRERAYHNPVVKPF